MVQPMEQDRRRGGFMVGNVGMYVEAAESGAGRALQPLRNQRM